jgi:acetate kinase
MKILVFNAGSSSQKTCLYEIGNSPPDDAPAPLWEAKIDINGDSADVSIRNSHGQRADERIKITAAPQSSATMLEALWSDKSKALGAPTAVDAVAHRIVNGGPDYRDPILISTDVKSAIARMTSFAPLHNASGLAGIEFAERRFSGAPQIAVFDTGFHKTLPESAYVYPGPYEWLEQGIRRFGFHGINHEYCANRAAKLLGRDITSLKLVISHLGNGCSLAAVRGGQSIDTTMGFTPLEGLMMGTRSGSIDPGVITYLASKDATGAQLDELLNKKSGLLGISGLSGDMREIVQQMKAGNERAKLAFDIFVHRLRSSIGSMIATLGGIDALVFTAGIGENSQEIRAEAAAEFAYLGLEIDAAKNAGPLTADQDIAQSHSRVRILVIHAQEDWAMAKSTWELVSKGHFTS